MDETLCDMLNQKLSNMGKIIDGREEALVTQEDTSNQAALLRKLISMKETASKKKGKAGNKDPAALLQPSLI